ncbi:DUF3632 domain-containing protein [Saccharopolyspora gloriosae]|uniref:DUF3632 domain-containing protein n=1 Tax=Saccharopolyspora gloriosae TaxID=455344 RepID=UPI001FB7F5F2|nr:DUF3632 domain-containing protein [Saccharopolyspora gloriosae]
MVFGDLPCFGAQVREAWDADGDGSTESRVNLNAFAARLTAAGIDFSGYAIWTLRDCLEDTAVPGGLHAVLPWLRHCGPELARLARLGSCSVPDRGPGRLGPLARAGGVRGGGFCPQRWAFWRGRLAELAAGPDAVAHQARTALELMPAVEGVA